MIKNVAYELVTGNEATYGREEFLHRMAALRAYAWAQLEVRSGKLTSASLAQYDEFGFPHVIRQTKKEN